MSNAALADPSTRGRDLRTISLVGLAHGTSHFFHMLLPPMRNTRSETVMLPVCACSATRVPLT